MICDLVGFGISHASPPQILRPPADGAAGECGPADRGFIVLVGQRIGNALLEASSTLSGRKRVRWAKRVPIAPARPVITQRITDVKPILRPRQGHVEQPPLLLDLLRDFSWTCRKGCCRRPRESRTPRPIPGPWPNGSCSGPDSRRRGGRAGQVLRGTGRVERHLQQHPLPAAVARGDHLQLLQIAEPRLDVVVFRLQQRRVELPHAVQLGRQFLGACRPVPATGRRTSARASPRRRAASTRPRRRSCRRPGAASPSTAAPGPARCPARAAAAARRRPRRGGFRPAAGRPAGLSRGPSRRTAARRTCGRGCWPGPAPFPATCCDATPETAPPAAADRCPPRGVRECGE